MRPKCLFEKFTEIRLRSTFSEENFFGRGRLIPEVLHYLFIKFKLKH